MRRRTAFYSAGLDHTYHRLVQKGLDRSRAVFVMHITTVVLGCIAFIALQLEPIYAMIVFGSTCVMGIGLILWLDWKK